MRARAAGGALGRNARACTHARVRGRAHSPAQSQHMTRPRRGATPTELGPPRARARADARATRASAARRTDRARPRGARALTAEGRQRGRARLARSRPALPDTLYPPSLSAAKKKVSLACRFPSHSLFEVTLLFASTLTTASSYHLQLQVFGVVKVERCRGREAPRHSQRWEVRRLSRPPPPPRARLPGAMPGGNGLRRARMRSTHSPASWPAPAVSPWTALWPHPHRCLPLGQSSSSHSS